MVAKVKFASNLAPLSLGGDSLAPILFHFFCARIKWKKKTSIQRSPDRKKEKQVGGAKFRPWACTVLSTVGGLFWWGKKSLGFCKNCLLRPDGRWTIHLVQHFHQFQFAFSSRDLHVGSVAFHLVALLVRFFFRTHPVDR